MGQITGALIGITLVLTAVFIPMAFFSGSVGTIYRQFSLSLVSSMLFSGVPRDVADARVVRDVVEADSQRAQTREARIFRLVQSRFCQSHHELSIVGWPNPET